MRYKFSIPNEVKGLIEWKLEHYKEMKEELEQYKHNMIPSPTPSYSLTGGGGIGGESRPNENIALKMVTDVYIRETERTVKAIERVMLLIPEDDKRLIDLVYWKQTYTVEGASMILNMSKSTAYYHLNIILTKIAAELGLTQYEQK